MNECGVVFERCWDGAMVPCARDAGHTCAHHWEPDEEEKDVLMWRRSSICIGGHRYTVSRVKRTHPELNGGDGGTDFAKCKMWLASDLEGDALEDAFLHEVGHVIDETSGAKGHLREAFDSLGSETPAGDVDKLDERLVGARTPVLHRLLKDYGFSLVKKVSE